MEYKSLLPVAEQDPSESRSPFWDLKSVFKDRQLRHERIVEKLASHAISKKERIDTGIEKNVSEKAIAKSIAIELLDARRLTIDQRIREMPSEVSNSFSNKFVRLASEAIFVDVLSDALIRQSPENPEDLESLIHKALEDTMRALGVKPSSERGIHANTPEHLNDNTEPNNINLLASILAVNAVRDIIKPHRPAMIITKVAKSIAQARKELQKRIDHNIPAIVDQMRSISLTESVAHAVNNTKVKNPKGSQKEESVVDKLSPMSAKSDSFVNQATRSELIHVAREVKLQGTTLAILYENGMFDESHLRKIVKEYIKGRRIERLVAEAIASSSPERQLRDGGSSVSGSNYESINTNTHDYGSSSRNEPAAISYSLAKEYKNYAMRRKTSTYRTVLLTKNTWFIMGFGIIVTIIGVLFLND